MEEKEYQRFKILFTGSFFAFGLFQESIACIFCGIFALFFFFQVAKNKGFQLYCSIESGVIAIVIILYLPAACYGVDLGMGWIGFLKMLTVLFFGCCTMQLSEEQRDRMLGMIPAVGCTMTVFGIFSYGIKPAYHFFFMADRLGGFFQYANVFALFCLTGLVLLSDKLYVQAALLLTGILLSGSRTVFCLAVVSGILIVIHNKRFSLPFLLIAVIVFTIVLIYVGVTGNVQNVGRFLTVSVHSSTFLGRILYVKDGIRLCMKHPFGLGYLGYYFVETSIQTGVYSVRYIHNGYLQMALDIGIIPAVLFLYVIASSVFSKRKPCADICVPYIRNKERNGHKRLVTAVIALHCLVDFDLEFTSIWFVLLLTMNLYQGKKIIITTGYRCICCKTAIGILAAVGVYTGIAMLFGYLGHTRLSVQLLPLNTEMQREALLQETDSGKAEQLAEKILKQNVYIPEAYDVLSAAAYQKGDFQKMSEYKMRSVKLQRYNKEAYERYVILLSLGIEAAERNGDRETAVKLMEDVLEVDRLRSETEGSTDALAYKIRDVPDLTFSAEVENYMDQVKMLLGK